MRGKLKTLKIKRARQAKQFAPEFDIRALEAELRKENQHSSNNNLRYRLDYGRMATNERNTR